MIISICSILAFAVLLYNTDLGRVCAGTLRVTSQNKICDQIYEPITTKTRGSKHFSQRSRHSKLAN